MKILPNNIYHIYNRGNNEQLIFHNRDNYLFFLKKVRIHIFPLFDILAYCLMPNHFHFLIFTPIDFDHKTFSNALKILLSSYTRAINAQNKTNGSLFQQHTRARCLSYESKRDTDYGIVCFNYIHQNPLIASLVKKIEDWEFSSFKDYVGLRNGTLCNKKLALELLRLPADNEEFYCLSYNKIDRKKIEHLS